jgi:hypothetical protein
MLDLNMSSVHDLIQHSHSCPSWLEDAPAMDKGTLLDMVKMMFKYSSDVAPKAKLLVFYIL